MLKKRLNLNKKPKPELLSSMAVDDSTQNDTEFMVSLFVACWPTVEGILTFTDFILYLCRKLENLLSVSLNVY